MNKLYYLLALCVLIFVVSQTVTAQSPEKLWFDKPATHFEEGLVLANGIISGLKL